MYLYDIKLRDDNYRGKLNRMSVLHTLYRNNKGFEVLGKNCGIYMMYNVFGEILYIGQSKNFYNRFRTHHKFKDQGLMSELSKIRLFIFQKGELETQKELDDLEVALIVKEQPRFNEAAKNNKVVAYADKYSSEMLYIADANIGQVASWKGMKHYHCEFCDYMECTFGCCEMYNQWTTLGVPNLKNLKMLHEKYNVSVDDLATLFCVPKSHIIRKLKYDEYREQLRRYYTNIA